MEQIRKLIYKQVAEKKITQAQAKEMLLNLIEKSRQKDDIAIVGIGGKFPGAGNVNEFWDNLVEGKCCIGSFPEQRRGDIDVMLKSPYFRQLVFGSGEMIKEDGSDLYMKGGYIEEVDKFDAGFFNIPPIEAKFMSPNQRLMLETAWAAVDDSGYTKRDISDTRMGVYIGFDNTEIPIYKYITQPSVLHETGSYSSILASRISYILNLKGPAMVVDTACSSSLVALHLACKAIKRGECDSAIVGGIFLLLKHFKATFSSESNLGMATSDGSEIKAYDKDAKGTIWSEACCAVLVKPLSMAVQDKDNIYAVIKGGAMNNDGLSNGITAPSAKAQEDVLVDAWKDAEIDPDTLSHIESHGTGTILGDPIEIKGLSSALKRYTNRKQFCSIGALKSNIGHSVSASGIAAVIKVVLSLKNEKIPANISFSEINPFIDLTGTPFYLNDRIRGWKRGRTPRRAGISAFGFSGTNCHMVLEETPDLKEETFEAKESIFTLSANNETKLNKMIAEHHRFLDRENILPLTNICFTASIGREHFNTRVAIKTHNIDDLKEKIKMLMENGLRNDPEEGIHYGRHKVVVDSKKNLKEGEITYKKINLLSGQASSAVNEYKAGRKTEWLDRICSLYVSGANIIWKDLYENIKCRKVSLPQYPLDKIRYWASIPVEALETAAPVTNAANTVTYDMLLGKCLSNSMNETVFETCFSTDQYWASREHKIMDKSVIPATAQLDMIRQAAFELLGDTAVELRNIMFFNPIVVEEYDFKYVHTIINKNKDYLTFAIASNEGRRDGLEREKWIMHSQGEIHVCEKVNETIDIQGLRTVFADYKIQNIDYRKNEGISFGDRWHNVEGIYFNNGSTLAHLKLREQFILDLKINFLHPALLDNAVNIMIEYISNDLKGLYLPFAYRSIKIYDRLTQEIYSIISEKEKKDSEIRTYDISIYNSKGRLLAKIWDYSLKQVERPFEIPFGYKRYWSEKNIELPDWNQFMESISGKTVAVITDNSSFSRKLIRSMINEKIKILEIISGSSEERTDEMNSDSEELKYWIGNNENSFTDIPDLVKKNNVKTVISGIGFKDDIGDGASYLNDASLMKTFYLMKALTAGKFSSAINVSVIVDNAELVTGSEDYINPYNSSICALCKVAEQESSNLSIKCLDVDVNTSMNYLIYDAMDHNSDHRVYYRNGKRFVEVFGVLDKDEVHNSGLEFCSDGIYIITGGLGGIGFEIAKHLTAHNKVNLALINRSSFDRNHLAGLSDDESDSRTKEKIRDMLDMESNGSVIECISCDISDRLKLNDEITKLRQKYGGINGIIHSAGVAGEGFLFQKEEKVFRKVISPKTEGTVNLDFAVKSDKLDFFILFSSITSIVGGPGQSDYAAANAFIDSFSRNRNRQGKKTVCINWPAWKDVGMAAKHKYAQGEDELFKSIGLVEGIRIFDRLVNTDIGQGIPVEINFRSAAGLLQGLPFNLSAELKEKVGRLKGKPGISSSQKLERGKEVIITGLDDGSYSGIQEKLARIWGVILGLEEVDIYENFHGLGGDSMLAAGLIREIDAEFPGLVSITDIFSYPSIAQLSDYIESSLKEEKSIDTGMNDRDAADEDDESADNIKLKEMLVSLEEGEGNLEETLEQLNRTFN